MMPQWRKLHSRITESEQFNDMPDDFTRLLWTLLPLALCREGRGLDNAAWVKAKVFPLRLDVANLDIGAALDWFAAHDMIRRYQANGRGYFMVPTWQHYQGNTTKEAESNYPAPPDELLTYSGPTPDLVQTYSGTDADADAEGDPEAEASFEGANAPTPPAPPPEKRKKAASRAKSPPPPAVEVARGATNLYPARPLWDGIVEVVGDDPANLDRWRKTCMAWVACGWNPKNVKGMMQHYADHKLPGDDRKPGGKGNGWPATLEVTDAHRFIEPKYADLIEY